MEKIKSVCVMRDLVKAVAELQDTLQERLGISLNEAVVLCSIGDGTATAGEISRSTGFKAPQTSKVIRTVEGKRLIERQCGNEDHRRMEFTPVGRRAQTAPAPEDGRDSSPRFSVPCSDSGYESSQRGRNHPQRLPLSRNPMRLCRNQSLRRSLLHIFSTVDYAFFLTAAYVKKMLSGLRVAGMAVCRRPPTGGNNH